MWKRMLPTILISVASVLIRFSVSNAQTLTNSPQIRILESRVRRPVQCKDNIKCKEWIRKGFCRSKRFDEATRALLCPVACGFCDYKEKPFPFFKKILNEKADPCQSFYAYSCGKLDIDNAKKGDIAFGLTQNLSRNNMKIQSQNLVEKSTSTAVRKMQEYLLKCMNTTAIEAANTTQIRAHIQKMGGCPMLDGSAWNRRSFDLTKALVELVAGSGRQALFGIDAHRPDTSAAVLPSMAPMATLHKNPLIYVDPTLASQLNALKAFIAEVMSYVGLDSKSPRTFKEITDSANSTVEFERKIALMALKNGEIGADASKGSAEIDVIKFNDLQKIVTTVDWNRYVRDNPLINDQIRSRLSTNPDFAISTAAQYKELNQLIQSTDNGILADYLVTTYTLNHVDELDDRFKAAAQRFLKATGASAKTTDRSEDCIAAVTKRFELVNDFLFIRKTISKKTMNAASEMFENLRAALIQMIRREPWMDAQTRSRAMNKIRRSKRLIAGVTTTLDQNRVDSAYSALNFLPTDSFMDMEIKIQFHNVQTHMMLMTKDSNAWAEDTLARDGIVSVNAAHSMTVNYILINAGIMQPPFFDVNYPAAVNYGSLGGVVGHELTHGIDTTGAHYDEQGLKIDWWDQQTRQKFDAKTKCLVDLYGSKIEPKSGLKINGNLTSGENVADHGGIRAAYAAYKRHIRRHPDKHLPGYRKFTGDQLFFISYAMFDCGSYPKASLANQVLTDPHTPEPWRIDLTLAHFPEFARAFKCRRGTPMNPRRRCSVW